MSRLAELRQKLQEIQKRKGEADVTGEASRCGGNNTGTGPACGNTGKGTRNLTDAGLTQLAEQGHRAEDWLEYIRAMEKQLICASVEERYVCLSNVYTRAFQNISHEENKTKEAYGQLYINLAKIKSNHSQIEAEVAYHEARNMAWRIALVHVASAEFEISRGNTSKARKLLEKARQLDARPTEYLTTAMNNLKQGKTVLLSEEETKNIQAHLKERVSPSSSSTADFKKLSIVNKTVKEQNDSGSINATPLEPVTYWLPNSEIRHTGDGQDSHEVQASKKAKMIIDSALSVKSDKENIPKSSRLGPGEEQQGLRSRSPNRPPVHGIKKKTYMAADEQQSKEKRVDIVDIDQASRDVEAIELPRGTTTSTQDFTNELSLPPSLVSQNNSTYLTIDSTVSFRSSNKSSTGSADGANLAFCEDSALELSHTKGLQLTRDLDDVFKVPSLQPAPASNTNNTRETADKDADSNTCPLNLQPNLAPPQPVRSVSQSEIKRPSNPDFTNIKVRQAKRCLLQPKRVPIHEAAWIEDDDDEEDEGLTPMDAAAEKAMQKGMDESIALVPEEDPAQPAAVKPSATSSANRLNQGQPQQPAQSQTMQQAARPSQEPLQSVKRPARNLPAVKQSTQAPMVTPAKPREEPVAVATVQAQPPQVPSTPAPNLAADIITVKDKTYIKLNLIGRGGSCKVYQVIDQDHKLRAIKCVDLEGADEATTQSFLNEISLLRRLQHSSKVIKMYDFEHRGNMLYVVMERGDTDLASLFKSKKAQGGISGHIRKFYWIEMLEAVNVLHKEGIVHADLKPANFLLVAGNLKLIDFGIACTIQDNRTCVTRDQQVGTLNYMSPEACIDMHGPLMDKRHGLKPKIQIGVRCDVWSLGCILYQMVHGRVPFQHITIPLAKMAAITDPNFQIEFPHLEDKNLQDVLKSCLTRNPRERPGINELLNHPYVKM